MKETVLSYLFVGLLSSTILFAQKAHAADHWGESLRPYVVKFLGADIANKLFGELPAAQLALPEIPKVEKDSTSTRDFPLEEGKREFKSEDKKNYDIMFLEELYLATRQIKPNPQEVSKWMNVLEQGGTREGVYRALVLDNSYYGLEGLNYPLTPEGIEFASEFMNKYLGKKISEKAIGKANFYTMKRLMTEGALEVIDQFLYEGRAEDLYIWYGILSAEIATNFPQVFEVQGRIKVDAEAHIRWAQTFSWQILKGEVIYKIHKVMNSLTKI